MTDYQNEPVMNDPMDATPMDDPFANPYETPAPVAPAKKSNKMLPVIVVAVVAVIAIILGIALLSAGGSKYVMEKQDFIRDDEGNIYLDGKKIAQLDFDYAYASTSIDGKTAIYYCNDEGEETETLYVVTKKGATEIASDVDYVSMSQDGKYVLYREDEMLVWYNVGKKKAENVGEDISGARLSPDGKTLAYAESEETDGAYEYTTFVKKWGGKATEIDLKNATPSMISNGAKYLYLEKTDSEGKTALYRSVNKKEPVKVCSNGYLSSVNLDRDEVIYYDRDKGTYYWVNGKKDGVKIAKDDAELVTPIGTMGVETFKGHVYYYGEDSLGYFDGKEMHKISSDVSDASISADGKTLYFTKSDDENYKLFYVKNATKGGQYNPAEVMEDVRSDVEISPDGKYAYITTEDDEMIVCKGKKKGDKIADDVSVILLVNDKGVCYFKDEDGVFYGTKNGKAKVQIADLSDEESTTRGLYGDYYYYEVEGDLYYTTGTKGVKAK